MSEIKNIIPKNSKFLYGTGESAWFFFETGSKINIFYISRYSTSGVLECKNTFALQNKGFNILEDYDVTYVSHCAKCTVIQGNRKYVFVKVR